MEGNGNDANFSDDQLIDIKMEEIDIKDEILDDDYPGTDEYESDQNETGFQDNSLPSPSSLPSNQILTTMDAAVQVPEVNTRSDQSDFNFLNSGPDTVPQPNGHAPETNQVAATNQLRFCVANNLSQVGAMRVQNVRSPSSNTRVNEQAANVLDNGEIVLQGNERYAEQFNNLTPPNGSQQAPNICQTKIYNILFENVISLEDFDMFFMCPHESVIDSETDIKPELDPSGNLQSSAGASHSDRLQNSSESLPGHSTTGDPESINNEHNSNLMQALYIFERFHDSQEVDTDSFEAMDPSIKNLVIEFMKAVASAIMSKHRETAWRVLRKTKIVMYLNDTEPFLVAITNPDSTEDPQEQCGAPALIDSNDTLDSSRNLQPAARADNSSPPERSDRPPNRALTFSFQGTITPVKVPGLSLPPGTQYYRFHLSSITPLIPELPANNGGTIITNTEPGRHRNGVFNRPLGSMNLKRGHEGQVQPRASKVPKRTYNVNDDHNYCTTHEIQKPWPDYIGFRLYLLPSTEPEPTNDFTRLKPPTADSNQASCIGSTGECPGERDTTTPVDELHSGSCEKPPTADSNQASCIGSTGQCPGERDTTTPVDELHSGSTEQSEADDTQSATTSAGTSSRTCKCKDERSCRASSEPRHYWQCSLAHCPAIFERECDKDEHEGYHEIFSDRPFRCEYCKSRFYCFRSSRNQISVCKTTEHMKCSQCIAARRRAGQAKDQGPRNNAKINCTDCRRKYATVFGFVRHMKEDHQKTVVFQCKKCPCCFDITGTISKYTCVHDLEVCEHGKSPFLRIGKPWENNR